MNDRVEYKATFYKGDLPEGGATDWWTKEQWEDHEKYVSDLKASGEYGKPVEITFNLQKEGIPEFDNPKPFSDAIISKSMYFIPFTK